jgi:hypothetical protein
MTIMPPAPPDNLQRQIRNLREQADALDTAIEALERLALGRGRAPVIRIDRYLRPAA